MTVKRKKGTCEKENALRDLLFRLTFREEIQLNIFGNRTIDLEQLERPPLNCKLVLSQVKDSGNKGNETSLFTLIPSNVIGISILL